MLEGAMIGLPGEEEAAPSQPLSPGMDVKRLQTAVEASRKILEDFRRDRYALIEQYVGSHYGPECSAGRSPVNLVEMAATIWGRELVAKAPAALVTTALPELRPWALKLQMALNRLMDQISFGDTLARVVQDALFGIGILKLGLTSTGEAEYLGQNFVETAPFADAISFDDFVFDTACRRMDKATFIGHRFRVPIEAIRDNPRYDPVTRAAVKPTEYTTTNETGDDRADVLTSGSGGSSTDEYRDHATAWELYLPIENLVVTLADETFALLASEPWQGPERGPYILLGFEDVPGNPLPLPPLANLLDAHILVNRLAVKTGQQADRQKTITMVMDGAQDDAKRILDAGDGEMVRVTHPDKVRELRYGGADPATLATMIQFKDLFTYMAGNLDALGGLSPQADTLGQDKLLTENASKRVQTMKDKVTNLARVAVRDLSWYLAYDPLIDIPLTMEVPGRPHLQVRTRYTAAEMRGDWLDYNFDIAPYSLSNPTPQQRAGSLMQILQQIIIPMMPQLQQQGIVPDWQMILRVLSEYQNMPELTHIMTFAIPMPGSDSAPVGDAPMKSPVTTRTNVRVNRPGATRGGKDQAMIAQLMGANLQPKEQAGSMRATG